jgi:PPM family protein phosphatase
VGKSSRDVQQFERVLLLGPDLFPPLSATVRADFGARSVRGAQQTQNTDHYLVVRLGRNQETLLTSLPDDVIASRFDEQAYGMAVADGMGAAGEMAARLAIASLLWLALRFGRWNVRVDDMIAPEIVERINHFYRQIDSAMVTVNRTSAPKLHTTLTAVVTGGRDLFFAHVGHSRAYLLRGDELIQLTRDHTHEARRHDPRARLLDLTDVAADMRHLLTDALGAGTNDPQVDIERLQLDHGDVVVLCTNGLTDVMDDREMARILAANRAPADQCTALARRATELGAPDDATVVTARYHIPV